jgi:hypothetical protein
MAVLPHVSCGADPGGRCPPGGTTPRNPRCASRLAGVLAVVSRGRRGRRPLAGRAISELRSSGATPDTPGGLCFAPRGGRPRALRVGFWFAGFREAWLWLIAYVFYITTFSREYSARREAWVHLGVDRQPPPGRVARSWPRFVNFTHNCPYRLRRNCMEVATCTPLCAGCRNHTHAFVQVATTMHRQADAGLGPPCVRPDQERCHEQKAHSAFSRPIARRSRPAQSRQKFHFSRAVG